MDKPTDRIVKRFDYTKLVKRTTCPTIPIYKNPDDYPGKYMARVYDMGEKLTNLVAVADTYEELLEAIPTGQMLRMERAPNDDPAIVETWV